jgi:hypothetical protein
MSNSNTSEALRKALRKAEDELLFLLQEINFNSTEIPTSNEILTASSVTDKPNKPLTYSVGHIADYTSDEDGEDMPKSKEKNNQSTSPSRRGLTSAKGKGVLARINKKISSASIISPIKSELNTSNYRFTPNPMYENSELDASIAFTPKQEVAVDRIVQLENVYADKWNHDISAEKAQVSNHDISHSHASANKASQQISHLKDDVQHRVHALQDIVRWKLDLDDYTALLHTVVESYFGSTKQRHQEREDGDRLLLLKLWETVKNKVHDCPLPHDLASMIKNDVDRSRLRVTEPSAMIDKYPSIFQCPPLEETIDVDADKFVVLSRSVEELCHEYFQFFLYIQCICTGITENATTRRPSVVSEDYVNKRAILIGFFMLNMYEERLTLKIAEHVFDKAVGERQNRTKYSPRLYYNDFVNMLCVAAQLLAASSSEENDSKKLKAMLDKHVKHLHQYSYNVDNTNNCNHVTAVLVTLLIPLTTPVILRQLTCYDLELYSHYKSCKSYNLITKKGQNLLHKGDGPAPLNSSFELFCAEHRLLGVSRSFIKRMEQYLHKYIQSDELSYFILCIYYLSLLATTHTLHTHTSSHDGGDTGVNSGDINASIVNNINKIYYHVKSVSK